MLSVLDISLSTNERTHTGQQQNKITYSVVVPEVHMYKLGNWLITSTPSVLDILCYVEYLITSNCH